MKRRHGRRADRTITVRGARIHAVGGSLDAIRPLLIHVDLDVQDTGTLRGRILVRAQRVGRVAFSAAPLVVDVPGPVRLIAEVPGGALGGGEHAVDVELWLGDDVGVVRTDVATFRVDAAASPPTSCLRGEAAWTRGAAS